MCQTPPTMVLTTRFQRYQVTWNCNLVVIKCEHFWQQNVTSFLGNNIFITVTTFISTLSFIFANDEIAKWRRDKNKYLIICNRIFTFLSQCLHLIELFVLNKLRTKLFRVAKKLINAKEKEKIHVQMKFMS